MQGIIFVCLTVLVYQTASYSVKEDDGHIFMSWNSRQKRMSSEEECHSLLPKPNKDVPLCCQMPNILPGTESVWETCMAKFKEAMDKPDSQEHKEMVHGKHEPPCLFQCVFMNIGLVTNDGKLDEQKITNKMSESFKNDANWGSIWQPHLNKCFNEIKNEKDEQLNHMMNTPAGKLMKCFLRNLYMSCPRGTWVESSECTNQKTLVQNCPNMPPPVFKRPPKLI
ncbi:uncharacterized protein LOC126838990 [Adelges cooleyi]|uniref:uncharacterized protein LOC126838990 n=1 Tax=Adelges cooleyi TaxID=133065 RepID=UPI00217FD55E|nr:uncharacterized protein LOC126838990 [Adelges cooleyi]